MKIGGAETPAGANTGFRTDINALRAIAVVAVVLYHLGVPGISGGFAGVDVFFVISGYLITGHIAEQCAVGRFSLLAFYGARLRRIFPALALVCVVCLAWGWLYVLPTDYIDQARHAAAAIFFVSNQAFAGERGYFDASALSKPLLHTWSLAIEGQFYLFLPLLFLFAQRLRRNLGPGVIGALLLASFAWCVYLGSQDAGAPFYSLSARAWELLAGGWLALRRWKKPAPALANAGSIAALLGLLLCFTVVDAKTVWPGVWTLLPVAATCLMLAAQDGPWLRPWLSSWPLQRLGDISYSLYLWHWPLLVFLHSQIEASDRMFGAGDRWLLLGASVLLATLSWKYVELPTRFNKAWWTRRRIWTGALLAQLLVLMTGTAIVASHGAPVRLPDYVRRANDAIFVNTPRDECFRQDDSTKDAPEAFCTMGATNVAPSILLWGDSHANQYLTAVSDAASALGQSGLIATHSGCSAADVRQGTPVQQVCDRFNSEVLRMLAQTPSIQTVVLGRFWGPEDLGNVAANLALVDWLIQHGKKVVLLGPLPYPGFNVPYVWSYRQLKAGHSIETMGLGLASQSGVIAMNRALQSGIGPAIARNQAAYINVFGSLCDNAGCKLVESGISHFRDDSHLSNTGAAIMRQPIQSALNALR